MFTGAVVCADEEVYVEDSARVVTDGHGHRISNGDHYGRESSALYSLKPTILNFVTPITITVAVSYLTYIF